MKASPDCRGNPFWRQVVGGKKIETKAGTAGN